MKRRIAAILTALCMTLLCLFLQVAKPAMMRVQASSSGTYGEHLTWTLDDEGTLTISGTGEMEECDYL